VPTGFVAWVLELPVYSRPARSQREAIKELKLILGVALMDMEADRYLLDLLEETGFRADIGSTELNVNTHNLTSISVALLARVPRKRSTRQTPKQS